MRFIFRRLCCLLLAAVLCFAMAACQGKEAPDTGYTRYTTQFFDTFDTIIQITGYTKTQEEFEGYAQFVHERFAHLSKLYDRFYEYTGVNNVRTINQNAGIAPVEVEPELLEKLYRSLTGAGADVSACGADGLDLKRAPVPRTNASAAAAG